jgi:hypothetical protein
VAVVESENVKREWRAWEGEKFLPKRMSVVPPDVGPLLGVTVERLAEVR